ncbi:MAG: hypothetical protein IH962_02075 [Chloroflexi bacterium]|nr:hypothetical protein [Chloroflexota bacterium]
MKRRVVLIMAIVALLMAIGSGPSFGPTPVQADHIKIFDMNDRNASKEYPFSGSGVSVVNGSNVDFKIVAEGLSAIDLYEVRVGIRKEGAPFSESFAMITFEAVSDAKGKLSFEKNNFNLEFLPAGDYRLDWMITHANFTDPGRTANGAMVSANTGLDPLLTCQPGTTVTVTE